MVARLQAHFNKSQTLNRVSALATWLIVTKLDFAHLLLLLCREDKGLEEMLLQRIKGAHMACTQTNIRLRCDTGSQDPQQDAAPSPGCMSGRSTSCLLKMTLT